MIHTTLKNYTYSCLFILFLFFTHISAFGQSDTSTNRLRVIEQKLGYVAMLNPGLRQKVQLSMSGASIQEFVRALAVSNNLNINIDPSLDYKITNNFSNETAMNILLFLAREYNLDINVIGSIISITRGSQAFSPAPPVNARYNAQENSLSLELNNDSLGLVARKITQLTKKNIVVPKNLLNRPVSAFFSDAPFESALEKLAFANNLKVTKTSDGVYVFQPLEEGEEVFINNDKNTSVRRNRTVSSSDSLPGSFNISSKTSSLGRKLLTIDAVNTPLMDLVKASSEEANTNYFIYSDIRGIISTHINNIDYDDFLSSLFQGTDYTFKKDRGIYLIGDRKLEGLRTNKVVQLQYRSIDTIQQMIPTEWRRGVEIKEFREQNTLLLSGSAPQIAEIENFIKQIDRLVPMVLIEVTLLDVRKGKTVSTGISAGVSDSVRTGGTVLPGLDYTFGAGSINDFLRRLGRNSTVNLGRVTPNFYVRLNALEQNHNVEIRSVPKLTTLNGHIANLSIGSRRYYKVTSNVAPSFSSQTFVTEQFNPVEANLAINIRPIVSGDDQITLNIKVDISDFIENTSINEPPPTSTSKFESIIRVKNEDMILLGGLERTENNETGSGVPFLSRIPVLKWIFSSRSKANNKVVTIVFIKPTIMY